MSNPLTCLMIILLIGITPAISGSRPITRPTQDLQIGSVTRYPLDNEHLSFSSHYRLTEALLTFFRFTWHFSLTVEYQLRK